jgi:tetratricopeptide (TPR) repeat protein
VLDRDELLEHVEWLLNEGESERAWMLCKRGLRRFPKDAELWVFMGDSLVDSGRLAEADKAFRRGHEVSQDWAIPLAKRSEVHLMLGNLPQARLFADEAHELDKDLPHASYIRAVCFEMEGSEDVAHFWYRRAQKLNPDQYFIPVKQPRRLFMKDFRAAVEHLVNGGLFSTAVEKTRWKVHDKVDRGNRLLRDVSPMAYVHLIPQEVPGEVSGEDVTIRVGFIFRQNILRDCRCVDDVYSQVYVSLLEELERLTIPAPDDDPCC